MLSFFDFFRQNHKKAKAELTAKANADGFLTAQSARELLESPRRQQLLAQIWERTSTPKNLYQRLYLAPLYRYAECVQSLPASENHHHSYLGGLLDHGLELMLYALRLRESYLLPPGAPPEEQAKQADAWTAGAALGALLHDIGKIAVDLHIETGDGVWHPWHGALKKPYRFRYRQDRDYQLHNAAAGLLYANLLGQEVMDWLSQYPLLWGSLLYLLAGDYEHAGVLGEIVSKADRTSTALNVGANPQKALQAAPRSLQSQLLRGLKHLLTSDADRLRLNQKGAAGWLTQDGLWLVSKVVSDRLRTFLLTEGVDGVPSKNSALFDELQAHALVQTHPSGQAVWHATVTDSDWVQTFSFLKVQPSLIWGSAEYPPVFGGTVTVETSDEALTQTEQAQAEAAKKPKATETASHASCRSEPDHPPAQDDSIDEVLALLADDGTKDSRSDAVPERQANPAGAEHTKTAAAAHTSTALSAQSRQEPPVMQFRDTPERTALGEAFIDWLRQRIAAHKLMINDASAPIHLVDGKVLLVSPKLFQRFCQEHPQLEAVKPQEEANTWQWTQKSFERLKKHHKNPANDLNIWTANVIGPRKKGVIKGYLLDASTLFDAKPPYDNPFISLPQTASTTANVG